MLYHYESNNLDLLRQELVALLLAHAPGPFEACTVVTASNAVFRWVAQAVAREAGVAAMLDHCTPDRLEAVLGESAGMPDIAGAGDWLLPALTWRIYSKLTFAAASQRYANLVAAGNGAARYRLAGQLAMLYQRYAVYRSDWLRRWQQGARCGLGPTESWQADLWCDLLAGDQAGDPLSAQTALDTWLASPRADGAPLYLLMAEAMSPRMLEVLVALAARRDVYLLSFNPCQEYWNDIVDYSQMTAPGTADAQYQEVGHPLLASLGRQGRSMMRLLAQVPDEIREHRPRFAEPEQMTLLGCIQRDVLRLEMPDGTDKAHVSAEDRSVQVHCCHSLQRELQVLRDQLLDLFERHPDLHLADVLVMTPDLEQAVPYIHSVFAQGQPAFDYRIVGRDGNADNVYARLLLEIIAVARGRFGADQVFGLLERPQVAACFGLDGATLDGLRELVGRSAIRWGKDAGHRAQLELPAENANTWAFGLDRMLAGVLMPDGDEVIDALGGILPLNEMDMAQARAVGVLVTFLQRLGKVSEALSGEHQLGAWYRSCQQWLEWFVVADEADGDRLQDLVAALALAQQAAGADTCVDAEVFVLALRETLSGSRGGGFLSGALTFAGLQPGHCLPHRVICLVGMDEGAFPHNPPRISFDLMQEHPRPGDNARVDDDRWLFLQCLLNSREVFYLSYTGRDIRDDSIRPPSVLLSQLLDLIDAGFRPPQGQDGTVDMAQWLTTAHPLQPFSAAYFEQQYSALFSYSASHCGQARALSDPSGTGFSFIGRGLAGQDAAPTGPVDFEELARFLVDPAGWQLNERLGIRLPRADDVLEDREPFVLRGFDRSDLQQEILQALVSGAEQATLQQRYLASGLLPQGAAGMQWLKRELQMLRNETGDLRSLLTGEVLQPLAVCIDTGAGQLDGLLRGLRATGLVEVLAGWYAGPVLRSWILHLVLCAQKPAGVRLETRIAVLDGSRWVLREVTDPLKILGSLLALYRRAHVEPLPFFPRSAWEWAGIRLGKGKDDTTAMKAAVGAWYGGYNRSAEADKPAIRYLWAGAPLPEPDFQQLAGEVFGPLFNSLEAVEDLAELAHE